MNKANLEGGEKTQPQDLGLFFFSPPSKHINHFIEWDDPPSASWLAPHHQVEGAKRSGCLANCLGRWVFQWVPGNIEKKTWKTAVATLISVNFRPLKPAIRLLKRMGHFPMFSQECFNHFGNFYPSRSSGIGIQMPWKRMETPCFGLDASCLWQSCTVVVVLFRSHDTSAVTFLNPAEAKIQIYSIVRMPVKSHEFQ